MAQCMQHCRIQLLVSNTWHALRSGIDGEHSAHTAWDGMLHSQLLDNATKVIPLPLPPPPRAGPRVLRTLAPPNHGFPIRGPEEFVRRGEGLDLRQRMRLKEHLKKFPVNR